jgi:hypothetical protein
MYWFALIFISFGLTAQSRLAVELPEGRFDITWNRSFMGEVEGGFHIDNIQAGQDTLHIQSKDSLNEIILHRQLQFDGNSDYRYTLTKIESGAWRLRYRGKSPFPAYPILRPVLVSHVQIPPIDSIEPKDSVVEEIDTLAVSQTKLDSIPVLIKVVESDSLRVEELMDPNEDFKSICNLSMEFDRLRASREKALTQELDQNQMELLLGCLQFDNSRLLFLNDVLTSYAHKPWFASLEKSFDFDLSKKQYRLMLQNHKAD